jgi:hypothetical protein
MPITKIHFVREVARRPVDNCPGPSTMEACFVVRDHNGQQLTYVYYEEEPGRRSAAKLLTRDEARPIAANIAKLPINDARCVATSATRRAGAVLVAVATATPTPIPITMPQTNIVSVKSISADRSALAAFRRPNPLKK